MTLRPLIAPAVGALLAAGGLAAPAAHAAPAHALAWDFDGDGHPDIAVGAPRATVGSAARAGTVDVAYGSAAGPDLTRHQVLSLATPGIPGSPGTDDRFGSALASGDLNGDGYADLVIGVSGPYPTFHPSGTTLTFQGKVVVVYGSARGLSTRSHPVTSLTAGRGSLPADASPTTLGLGFPPGHFGSALAVGDLNGDGIDDLAAGQPTRNQVLVFSGHAAGLSASPQRVPVDDFDNDPYDFGNSVAIGDVTGDGIDDLVAGVDLYAEYDNPAAEIFPGTRTGVGATPQGLMTGNYYDESYRRYDVVALGDIDGDGRDDIVLQGGTGRGGGSISVFLAKDLVSGHLLAGPAQELDENSPGVPGVEEPQDRWGATLAVARVDGDRYGDVVVGAPGEDLGGVSDAGAVTVLYGSASGALTRGQMIAQSTPGVPGAAERGDELGGGAVAATDLNGDGRADLLLGSPGENDGNGSVTMLFGGAHGVTTSGARSFGAASLGGPNEGSGFGTAIG